MISSQLRHARRLIFEPRKGRDVDILDELRERAAKAAEISRKEERERCAKLADQVRIRMIESGQHEWAVGAEHAARAIRFGK